MWVSEHLESELGPLWLQNWSWSCPGAGLSGPQVSRFLLCLVSTQRYRGTRNPSWTLSLLWFNKQNLKLFSRAAAAKCSALRFKAEPTAEFSNETSEQRALIINCRFRLRCQAEVTDPSSSLTAKANASAGTAAAMEGAKLANVSLVKVRINSNDLNAVGHRGGDNGDIYELLISSVWFNNINSSFSAFEAEKWYTSSNLQQ